MTAAIPGSHSPSHTAPAPPAGTAADHRPTQRHRRIRLALAVLLAGVLATEAVLVAPYIGQATRTLSHPKPWWLLLALLSELGSMGAFARMQRRMLEVGGTRVPIGRMLAMTYAANAVSVSLPAGSVISSGYAFGRLRRWGASVPLATFTLIASGLLSTVAFAGVGLVGALLTGANHSSPVLLVAGIVGASAAALVVRGLSRRPPFLIHAAERGLTYVNRLMKRDPGSGQVGMRQFLADLTQIRPRYRDWLAGLNFAVGNWVADLVCLVASCRALGVHGVTIQLAFLAYLAGMSISSLSLVPGGVGIVDGAMILVLTHAGVHVAAATAAVLLYRLISFVLVVIVGWTLWAVTWQTERRRDRQPLTRPATT